MRNPKTQLETLYSLHKAHLMSLCFRMLGNLAEAEEIVHDTFLAWEKAGTDSISNPRAWLTKVCSNKAINHLGSAYKRREVYPGTWLPDQIPDGLQNWDDVGESTSPEKQALLAESLTASFLLLVERLSPEQRVTYLLHEIFGYSFREISEFLEREIGACRKTAQRAREALRLENAKFSPAPENAEEILWRFYECAKRGDRDGLRAFLAKDSELWGDGGGNVYAAGHITTIDGALTFLQKLGATSVFRSPQYQLEFRRVSSRPGIVVSKRLPCGAWGIDTIMSYEFSGEKIARIYAQRSPEKLRSLLLRPSELSGEKRDN